MFQTRRSIPGSPPATLIPRAAPGAAVPPQITLIEYDAAGVEERTVTSIAEILPRLDNGKVTWINIDGLGDVEVLRALGEKFHLHPLALEDVNNTGQRPKTEAYDDYLFIVAQMVYANQARRVCGEQVCMFLGRNFLITVQEEAEFDVFEPVRARIRAGGGYIRKMKADYLAYALLDSIIDHFYPVLEALGATIEEFEDELLERPNKKSVQTLHDYRRTLMNLRRFVWPLRDVVNAMLHENSGFVLEPTKVFLRDCYDHTVQLMDLVESYRDVTSGLMELYLSSVGLKTNEIMRVLTVISSIFIPLTFVAGVYGMNFQPARPEAAPLWGNMPELYLPYGYAGCLSFMALVALGQLVFFRRKGWI